MSYVLYDIIGTLHCCVFVSCYFYSMPYLDSVVLIVRSVVVVCTCEYGTVFCV
jgi:hypothetical protein